MTFRRIVQIIIALALFSVSIVYLLRVVPRFNSAAIHNLELGVWLILIALFVIVQLMTILYYSLVLHRNLGSSSCFKLSLVLFASHSLNYAGPMKLGMPIRVFLFKKILEIPYSLGVGAVATTTGLDVVMMIAIVTGLSAGIFVSPLAGIASAIVMVACLAGVVSVFHRLPAAIPNRPDWIMRLYPTFSGIPIRIIVVVFLLSGTRLLLTGFAGWLLVHGLGSVCGFTEFSFAYFSSLLAGLLSFLPMGIGVKDASIIEFLVRLGTPSSVGVAFAVIDRIIWSFLPLIIGLGSGWYLGINRLIRGFRCESR